MCACMMGRVIAGPDYVYYFCKTALLGLKLKISIIAITTMFVSIREHSLYCQFTNNLTEFTEFTLT